MSPTSLPTHAHAPDIAEAGCTFFESTLALLDGTLSQTEQLTAQQHAQGCQLCGPLVSGWKAIGENIHAHFEIAAERAKPDLAQVSQRVFAALSSESAPGKPAWWSRLLASVRRSQAVYAFATAAAVAVIAVPVWRYSGPPSSSVQAMTGQAARANDLAQDVHPESGDEGHAVGFHMHELAFDGATGTVYTAGDEMPVIWLSEPEGA
jgi:hypothetical protein